MRLRLTKLFHKGTQNWTTQRGVIHPQLTLTSKPKLFVVWWHSAEVNLLCWSGFVKWGILSRLISPLYVHLNCGCHGSDRRRPSTQETTRRSSFQRESGAFFFFLSTHVSSDFKSPLCSSAERRWTLWWKYSLHYIWLFFSAPFDLQLVLYCAGYSPSEESSIKGELQ